MGESRRSAKGLAIISISGEGTILTANERAVEMFGYNKGELEGQDISCLVTSDLLERHKQLRDAYLDNPVRRLMGLQRPFPAKKKDGTKIMIKGSLSPTNTPTGFVVTCVFEEHEHE